MRQQLAILLALCAFSSACNKEEKSAKPAPAAPVPAAPPAPSATIESVAPADAKAVRIKQRKNLVSGPGAALVNGYPILVAEVNDLAMVYCQQAPGGCGTDEAKQGMKRAAMDFLIDLELVTQAAMEKGLAASDEEVQQKIEAVTKEMGGIEKYQEILTKSGSSEAEAREEARDEIIRSKLLKQVRDEAAKVGGDARKAQEDFILGLRTKGKIARYEEY